MTALKLPARAGLVGAVVAVGIFVGVLVWGALRQVPVRLDVKPPTAVTMVDGKVVKTGDRVRFGRKTISVEAPGFVPFRTTRKQTIFSTLTIAVQLRPLPQAEKIAEGDFLRQDRAGQIFHRSVDRLFRVIANRKSDTPITDSRFADLTDIAFSPDGLLAWVQFADGSNGIFEFNRYDITGQELIAWDRGVQAAAWLPSSSSSEPDRQRLVYLHNNVLFRTDPLRKQVERLIDLSPENIIDAELEWAASGDVVLISANNLAYVLELSSKNLSKLPATNVSSARFTPDSMAIVYTSNGQLIYQKFSRGANDNLGKILVEQAVPLNVMAEARDGSFLGDGKSFVAQDAQTAQLVAINLADQTKRQFYHQPLPANPRSLKIMDDKTAYFESEGSIFSLSLDNGDY